MNYDINKLEKEYKVRLDDAQRKALSDLTSFITSDEHCICLTGSAGTSKSMIASMLYDILADNGYWTAFIAPTNKAKLVLESKGLLGLFFFPILEVSIFVTFLLKTFIFFKRLMG